MQDQLLDSPCPPLAGEVLAFLIDIKSGWTFLADELVHPHLIIYTYRASGPRQLGTMHSLKLVRL